MMKKYPLYLNGKWVITETTIPVPINHGDKEAMESNPDHLIKYEHRVSVDWV